MQKKNSPKKGNYRAPGIRSEKVDIGVFGSYSDDDSSGGNSSTPIQFLNPLFHWCCS